MDPRTAGLQARLATVGSFRDLVNAMRGVAAARAQQARTLIDGVDAFAATIADAMAQALALLPDDGEPPSEGPTLQLVLGPEQGFNGGLGARVLDAVPDLARAPVMLVGRQALRLAHARGARIVWQGPLMSHAHAAVAAGDDLHAALAETQLRCHAARVDMTYPAVAAHGVEVRHERLLPLDLASMRQGRASAGRAPATQLPAADLVTALATEHESAQLVRALLHAHAAENLARLQAMAAAHDNVERMIEDLHAQERQQRQSEITEEIVELAAGLRGLRWARA